MVIIQRRVGQLGNQMFTMAHFAAAAIEHNYFTIFPCFEYPLKYFPNINSCRHLRVFQANDRLNRSIHRSFKFLRMLVRRSLWHEFYISCGEPFTDVGSDGFVANARKKIVVCEGFGFRDQKSILKHAHFVVDLFSLDVTIRQKTNALVSVYKLDRNVVLVGFHVRRGDYRTYRDGEYFFRDDIWLNWIRQARALFGSGMKRFVGIICSDDRIDKLVASSPDLICGPGDIYEDLVVLSKCNYIIGPPSTFSGWASFTGRVPILYVYKGNQDVVLGDFTIVTG